MKLLSPKAIVLLSALFAYSAVAAFYPVNRGMVNQVTYVVTAAGTTTPAATANQVYVFTGSSTQTLKLPNATNLPVDWWYDAINNSTGTVTVNDNSGSAIVSLPSGRAARIFLRDKTTAAGTWASWAGAAVADLSNYYLKSEFIASSTGASDAGKPVKTNVAGQIDSSMLPAGGSSWALTGNAGLTAGTNFLGTTDGVDLLFKTNNAERFRIDSSGNLKTQLTASRPLLTDSLGNIVVATMDSSYLTATSGIQEQLDTVWKLAGRSGGQVGYGGTGASDTATIRSTSNGTVGSVIIADQTGEKTRVGPTGSAATFNNTHEFLITGGSNSATDGLVVRRNNISAFNAGSGSSNAAGIALLPRGPSAAPEIRFSSTGGDQDAYIRMYDTGFGSLYGYLGIGSTFKIMNSSTALVPFWVSGTTGQAVPLQKWSNQSDGANFVSQVAKDGHFQGPNGSASVPSFGFLNDTNTGMYGDGSDALYFSTGGTQRASISSSGLRVGVAGATTGVLLLDGSTSGTVTVQPAATAGTYNFNLPTSAGSSGQPLLSAGGGASPMTFGTLGLAAGGTGATTKAAAFDALSPMTTSGDLIYGGVAGTGTRLATGNSGTVLTMSGGVPAWVAPTTPTVRGARVSTAGSGTINSQGPSTWISSVTHNAQGDLTLTLTAGVWSTAVWCTFSAANGNSFYVTGVTINTSTVRLRVFDSSGAAQEDAVQVVCIGT